MKIRYTILLILISSIAVKLRSQTFEEYKKQQQSEMDAFKQKQQEFIDQLQDQFNEYVKQRDKEFADYLKNRWEEFQVMQELPVPEIPEPPVAPEYDEESAKEQPTVKIDVIQPENIQVQEEENPVIVPKILKEDELDFERSGLTFEFFGFQVALNYDASIRIEPPATINPTSISKYWQQMSRGNYNQMIADLESYKSRMNLNDYGYYLLLDDFAKNIYHDSENGKNLLLWVMLNRSGFKARVAYAGDKMSLLLPSHNTVYSKSFLTSGGLNYYLMDNLGTENIFTYEKDYPGANEMINFGISSPLNLEKKLINKSVGFTYRDKPYAFNLSYNQNLIDFYKDYPQVDLNVYFDAAVSPETKESLLENLRPVINGMSEAEAVGFLLRFVQVSFNYETDQQQFKKEKFFFPEEMIYYPYSDCEDRSIFFAYLVRELMNLKVIGLEYPGHIATAVHLNKDVDGDYLMFDQEKYIMADPTFINAPLGMTMPEYKGKQAQIIKLENLANTGEKYKTFWDRAEESGGYRGDNLQDIVFDEDGNAYLTGYFEKEARFGDYFLVTGSDDASRNAFLVKYDKSGNVAWAKRITGNKVATGFSIVIENNNDLYVAGSFTGTIGFDDDETTLKCMDGLNDVFIAKYNVAGRMIWARKAGLDTYPQENILAYMTKFTKDGANRGTTFYCEDENFKNFGLKTGPMNLLYLTGSFNSTSGFALKNIELATNEGESFDLLSSLKAESDKLIAENYETSIAGLFSVVNHIKYNGIKISGKEAQLALDKYNANFKKKYPSVYESIGLVNFLLNDDGIILLETVGGKSVTIDKLRINNDSKIRITSYSGGDAQIDVLSGILVGKLFVWFDLNYVKLFKKSGDLKFDYDSDHTQKVLNLKEDLLY